MRQIYLDYNATTPIAPSVQEAMLPFLCEHFGNPSSEHSLGRACQEAIEDARFKVASLLGADPEEIVFTSCGTESNNLAILGVFDSLGDGVSGGRVSGGRVSDARAAPKHLVISACEHPAVAAPAAALKKRGHAVSVVGCDAHGVIRLDAFEAALRPNTVLVSIMHANNEIGVVQPISEIAKICRERGILLHTDAAQSTGKIRVSVDEMQVDLLTVAGHKLYAPKGIGVLFVRNGVSLTPILHGAGHESGLRPGTENTPYIVALGKAAELAGKCLDDAAQRLAMLRDALAAQLQAAIGEPLKILGAGAERLPNTLSLCFPNVIGRDLLARCPEICASTGAACHSSEANMSDTLRAIRLTPEQAAGAVRLSVGWYTSEEDIERAASLLAAAWEALQ